MTIQTLRLPSWLVKILALLIILPIILPLFRFGFFSIHDETHMVDLYEMYRALQLGFPPRWIPDVNFSLGYPYFNFYYHLPFYITSFFMWLGFPMTVAFKAFLLAAVLSSFIGFYFFAQRHMSKLAAIISAAIYVYTPYFAVDLYVRGDVGEMAVFALLPWIGFSLHLLIEKFSSLRFVLASVLIGLLAIAHNILNIFNFPLLFSYGLLLIFQRKANFRKNLLLLFLTFLTGLLISSYYWLPALVERQFISNYEQIKIEDQFPFLKQLIIPFWGYGTSHWGPNDEMSFQIGIANLLALLGALISLILVNKQRGIRVYFLTIFAIAFILMNSRSIPFWNLHPILRYFQFPWRLLLFTTLTTAILGGIVLDFAVKDLGKKRRFFYSSLVLLAVVLLTVGYFHPSEYKIITDERYLELYFANRTLQGNGERSSLSKEYLNFSEDFIPPTKWQKHRANDLPKRLADTKYPASLLVTKNNLVYSIDINSVKQNTLIVYNTFFPGWTGYMDSVPTKISPFGDLGIISLSVPAGAHRVIVKFEDTLIRKIANSASVVGILFLLILIFTKKIRKK